MRVLYIKKSIESKNRNLLLSNVENLHGWFNLISVTNANELIIAFGALTASFLFDTYLIRKEWKHNGKVFNLKVSLGSKHNYSIQMAKNDFNYYFPDDSQLYIQI